MIIDSLPLPLGEICNRVARAIETRDLSYKKMFSSAEYQALKRLQVKEGFEGELLFYILWLVEKTWSPIFRRDIIVGKTAMEKLADHDNEIRQALIKILSREGKEILGDDLSAGTPAVINYICFVAFIFGVIRYEDWEEKEIELDGYKRVVKFGLFSNVSKREKGKMRRTWKGE